MALKECKECGNDVSTEAASCPKCGAVLKRKIGFWRIIGAAVLIFITLIAISSLITSVSNKKSSSPPTAEVPDSIANKRFEECREKLKKAQQAEALYDFEWKRAMPKVVVGPTFYAIPIDAKQGLADTVNCFLMAGKSSYIDFDILDWQTGKRVAQYSLGRLKMD